MKRPKPKLVRSIGRGIGDGCLNELTIDQTRSTRRWFAWSGPVQEIVYSDRGPVFALIEFIMQAMTAKRLGELEHFSYLGLHDFDDPIFSRPTKKFAMRSCGNSSGAF